MTFKRTMIAAAACLTLASTVAMAQPMPGMGGHGMEMGRPGMMMLEGLNLTDAQKQAAQEIIHGSWQQARPLMQQLRGVRQQFAGQLLAPGSVTAAQFAPLMQQEQALRAQLDTQRLDTALKLRALLTPEQLAQAATKRDKLVALHAQMRDVMHEGQPAAK